MSKVKIIRWTVRLLLLATALFFIVGGPLPSVLERLVPALSPLSLLAESLAQRTWFAGLFWGLPPLAVLLLAVLKGRFFCQWICPLGTLYALPQKISLKKKLLPVRFNALIFWMILSASLFGAPFFLFFDPLSTVSRAGAWYELLAWIPGLLIPLFLLLSFFQPQVWCTHFCPLGYFFDLANRKNGGRVFNRDRRQFIAGCGLGISAAALAPKLVKPDKKKSVMPPGANDKFADTCTRCYACISACPADIIRVKKGGSLQELALPELVFDEYGCEESCNICSQVCPTGAIRNLSHDQKWRTQIGVAHVDKDKCLAWTDKEYCMVCDEFCPYNAIEIEVIDGDIHCPVVNADLCRGCGGCESACPAMRAGKAIRVQAAQPQRILSPELFEEGENYV